MDIKPNEELDNLAKVLIPIFQSIKEKVGNEFLIRQEIMLQELKDKIKYVEDNSCEWNDPSVYHGCRYAVMAMDGNEALRDRCGNLEANCANDCPVRRSGKFTPIERRIKLKDLNADKKYEKYKKPVCIQCHRQFVYYDFFGRKFRDDLWNKEIIKVCTSCLVLDKDIEDVVINEDNGRYLARVHKIFTSKNIDLYNNEREGKI